MNTLISDLKNLLDNHLTTVEGVFINYEDHCKPKNIKLAVRINDWRGILYFLQRYEYQTSVLIEAYLEAQQLGDRKLMELLYPQKIKDPEYLRVKNYDNPAHRSLRLEEVAIENDDLELYIKAYNGNGHLKYDYYDVRSVLEKGACSILKYILEHCNSSIDDENPPPPIKDPRIARIIVEDLKLGRCKFTYSLDELILVAKYYNHDVVANIFSNYVKQIRCALKLLL